jgi:hypothetical protein
LLRGRLLFDIVKKVGAGAPTLARAHRDCKQAEGGALQGELG